MLNQLLAFLLSLWNRHRTAAEQRDSQRLDELAPLKDDTSAFTSHREGNPAIAQTADHSIICREMVLDRKQQVIGYEFMLRGRTLRDSMRLSSRRAHHLFYNEVMINHLLRDSVSQLLGQRRAFVTVLGSFLAHPIFDQWSGQGVVLTAMFLGNTGDLPDTLVKRVAELKQHGFQFALEECFEGAPFKALAPYTDYFIVKTSHRSPAEIQQITEKLKQHYKGAALLARDVASFDDFQLCNKLGFTLFQGVFITRCEDWADAPVGPQTLLVCDLLNHLRREADTTELTQLLKQDAVLSYRLLRYINSAATGLPESVTSIEHALVLIGRQKMYRWLTLVLLSSAQSSPYAAALQETALARGRFMELISIGAFTEAERGSLFVTGLFSMLDLVLQTPLSKAIKPLHLPEAIEIAILHGEGPYAPFLELAAACESSNQERIEIAATRCKVNLSIVNAQHFEALAWAQAIQF